MPTTAPELAPAAVEAAKTSGNGHEDFSLSELPAP
jgi:hypothetical protein